MTAIGTGYDLSPSQFSSDGRIFQIEYAAKAVDNSGTSIALRGKDGVVFAVEKLIVSKLYEPGENKRIFTVGNHVGCAVAGVIADARSIIKQAQEECKNYKMEYGHEVPLEYLKNRVALYIHAHTLYSALRPFGASILMGSWDKQKGAQLYCLEPSGDSNGYFGIGIGKTKQTIKTEIEKLKLNELTCEELVKEAAKIIYVAHDEIKDKQFELELSWVGEFTNGKHEFVPKDVYNKAEEYAKESLRQDSDIDEDA